MHEADCLFCRIAQKLEPSFVIWEDAAHIAALTPFPNTPGFTVLFTREHRPSYIFELSEEEIGALMRAAAEVARLLDRAFGNGRSAVIAEGMGINHAHIKIIPLHGVSTGPWQPILSNRPIFRTSYEGFVSSEDGPQMQSGELAQLQQKILAAKK